MSDDLDLVGKVRLDTSQLRTALVEVQTSLVTLGQGMQSLGAGTGLATAANQALAFAGALAPAAGLVAALPGGIALVGVALATVAVGAGGFSETLKRGLAGVQGQLKSLQKEVQKNLFADLDRQIGKLASVSLPTLRTGMSGVAKSLNQVAKEAIGAMQTPLFQGRVGEIFAASARITKQFADAIGPLIQAFASLAVAALPTIETFTGFITHVLASKAAFIASAEGMEQMRTMIENGAETFSSVASTLYILGQAIATIIRLAANPDLLTNINSIAAAFRDWTASAEGQEALVTIFGSLQQISQNVSVILPVVAGAIAEVLKAINALPEPVKDVIFQFAALSVVLAPIMSKLTAFTGLLTTVGGGLIGMVGKFVAWRGATKEAAEESQKLAKRLDELKEKKAGLEEKRQEFLQLGRSVKGVEDELQKLNKELDDLDGKKSTAEVEVKESKSNDLSESGKKGALSFIGGLVGGIAAGLGSALTGVLSAIVGAISWPVLLIAAGVALAAGLIVAFHDEIWRFLTETLPNLISEALGAIGDFSSFLLDKGRELINGIINGAQEKWDEFVQWLVFLPESIGTAIGELGGTLFYGGKALIRGLWDGAQETWNDVYKWFTETAPKILAAIGDTAKTLWQKGKDLLKGFWSGVTEAWDANFKFWTDLPGKARDAIGDVLKTLWQKGKDLISGLWGGIKQKWEDEGPAKFFLGLALLVPILIGAVIKVLYQKGRDFISGLWDGVKDVWNSVASWFSALPGKIKESVGNARDWLKEAGRDIMRGLLDGIGDLFGSVVSKMKNVGHAIVEGFKSKEGIDSRSPSKKMIAEGHNIIDGITTGLGDRVFRLRNAMKEVSDAVIQPMRVPALQDIAGTVISHTGMVQAEDGGWVPPSYYGTAPPPGMARAEDGTFVPSNYWDNKGGGGGDTHVSIGDIHINGDLADRDGVHTIAWQLADAIKAKVGSRTGR